MYIYIYIYTYTYMILKGQYRYTYLHTYIYIYLIYGSYGKYMFVVDEVLLIQLGKELNTRNMKYGLDAKGRVGLDFWKPTLMIHAHLSDYMP